MRAAAPPRPRAQHSSPLTHQAKEDASDLMEQSKAAKAQIADLEQQEKDAVAARDAALVAIGNIVHDSVPVSDDEVGGDVTI